jgi:lipopolysaccharide export system permease protein
LKTVERYLTRQIARTGAAALLVIATALILHRTLWMVGEVDPAQLPAAIALALLACKVPEVLAIAVTPAFFAGILLTFQRLVREGELDALYASGVGLVRLLRPLLMLSAAVAALTAVLLWFLVPAARYEYAALLHEAARAAVTAPFKAGTFVRFDGNVLYIHPEPGPGGGTGSLFLYQQDRYGLGITTAVTEGFRISPDGARLFAVLGDGQRLTVPHHSGKVVRVTFDRATQQIYAADPGPFRPRGEDVRELTAPELAAALRDADGDPGPWLAQLHTKLARVVVILLLPLTALPLAMVFPVGRQGLGIALGAALIIGIDQALIFGETLVDLSKATPWTGVWSAAAGFLAAGAAMAALQGRVTPRARW